jgi:outer membrane biosynthesis protein TonB
VERARDHILKSYEIETEALSGRGEWLFRSAMLFSFAAFGCMGLYLRAHNPPPHLLEEKMARARQVSFLIEEQKKSAVVRPKPAEPPKPKPAEPEKKAPLPQEPIDLTKKPELDRKIDDPTPDNTQAETPEPVRRVYGLRKVYSTGIGEGGSASDAVIGKRGNTLATDIDTFTAIPKDLKGTIAPITTVTLAPKLLRDVKPEYTKEMIEAKVEGPVKAHLLIDIDGSVKQVKILNDLGYGTKERATEAFLQWIFEPAKKGDQPVAVWITFSIRFVLLPG